MRGSLALVGSGEFTPALLEADRFLLSKLEDPKVAIIPTAAGREAVFQKWIDDGVQYFKALGAKVQGIPIKGRSDASVQNIINSLNYFNFFYFSGGDPGYLLESIKDTPAWSILYRAHLEGATLTGSSAGAMVLGSKTWSKVYKFIDQGILDPWEDGLAAAPFGVIPHYDTMRRDFADKFNDLVKSLPSTPIVGIDEDTAYINDGEHWKVIGRGKIHIVK